jgi:hypothetical protein
LLIGDLLVAGTACAAALALHREQGNRFGATQALTNLGWVEYFLGRARLRTETTSLAGSSVTEVSERPRARRGQALGRRCVAVRE